MFYEHIWLRMTAENLLSIWRFFKCAMIFLFVSVIFVQPFESKPPGHNPLIQNHILNQGVMYGGFTFTNPEFSRHQRHSTCKPCIIVVETASAEVSD